MHQSFLAAKLLRHVALAFLWMTVCGLAAANELTQEERRFFEAKIRPVLIKECYGCHSNQSGNVRGGLRLDTEALTHIGGSSGPAIVPGNLEESLLFNAITHEDWVMPPNRKLDPAVIRDFRTWIEMGAPDPRKSEAAEVKSSITADDIELAKSTFWAYQPPVNPTVPAPTDSSWGRGTIDSFVLTKLESMELEPTPDAEPHQILRRLCFDILGLPPTPEQIRYFERIWEQDPEQATAFVVDQLLDKPQYGERWGRHWLDVARYAESTGRGVNMTYPHAWRYRDYVIDSFNADKPYNEFIQEQIAGDLLPVQDDEEWAENLIATTFLAIGPKNLNEQNRVQFAMDLVDEQIDATTRVFLGMSVACARCHDHKFDAIRQSDYYAMAGLFRGMTTYFGNPPSEFGRIAIPQRRQNSSLIVLPVPDPNPYDKRYSEQEMDQLREQFAAIRDQALESRRELARQGAPGNGTNGAEALRQRLRNLNQMSDLSDKLAVVNADGEPISYCMGVQQNGVAQDAKILIRGEIDQAAQVVPRGIPEVLTNSPIEIPTDQSGRLQLARWLGSNQNTLVARVMVNRIWQNMLGQGLVDSPENFGVTGSAPSHPELLDYLAVRFVESGWSVKSLIREIALSRVYRMDSTFDQESHEVDPSNRMLWRANPRRLDAEALRDAMLAVSSEINLERPRGSEVAKAGYTRVRNGVLGDPREIGRRVAEEAAEQLRERFAAMRSGRQRPAFSPSNRSRGDRNTRYGGFRSRSGGANSAASRSEFGARSSRDSILSEVARKISHQLDMEEATFRSVYLPIVRDEVPRSLEVFDFADANSIVGAREQSNTPNQALYMLNNPFVIEQSKAFAKRLQSAANSPKQQIELAFQLAYGRSPTRAESEATIAFLRGFNSLSRQDSGELNAVEAFCQSLFASAEFRFLD